MAANLISIEERGMGIKDVFEMNDPINTSIYYYLCTMKLDLKSPFLAHNSTDPGQRYSDTLAFMAGLLTVFQMFWGITLNFLVIMAIIRSPHQRCPPVIVPDVDLDPCLGQEVSQ